MKTTYIRILRWNKKLENVVGKVRGKSGQFARMIYTYWIKLVLHILEEKRGFEKT